MAFLGETLSNLSSNSLFSAIVTFYTLILLYFPSLLHKFVLSSPVFISTTILLLSLLRLGAEQNSSREPEVNESDSPESNPTRALSPKIPDSGDHDQRCVSSQVFDTNPEPKLRSSFDPDPNPFYSDSFLEWDVRAPLEVIYEEYEGEEGDDNDDVSEKITRETQMNIIRRYASLSLFYPESDSDASSDEDFRTSGGWDSSEDVCFRWEEEDVRDGLIEIALDEKRNIGEFDEDNLIEIDLSPAG